MTDASTLACQGATDIARALTGLHPNDVWITRLEANLPQKALDVDLLLGASTRQDTVLKSLNALEWENGGDYCYGSSPPVPMLSLRKLGMPNGGAPMGTWVPIVVAAAGLAFAARRLRTEAKRC